MPLALKILRFQPLDDQVVISPQVATHSQHKHGTILAFKVCVRRSTSALLPNFSFLGYVFSTEGVKYSKHRSTPLAILD